MIPRLYIPQPLQKSASLQLSDAQMHYLRDVLRLKEGDMVKLFNGKDGEWEATLTALHKKYASVSVTEKIREQKGCPDIWLCFAPIKHAALDFMIEKATELGATRLQPVMTKFTNVSRVNVERMRANAIEAAEQCERLDVPEVMESLSFEQLLGGWAKERTLVYGDESGESESLGVAEFSTPLALLVGPEGGFSNEEHYILRTQAFVRGVCLGPRVLRAETAAIAMLACVMSACGDWDQKPNFEGV